MLNKSQDLHGKKLTILNRIEHFVLETKAALIFLLTRSTTSLL